ncbi:MAG TPA: cation:proton antiporter [Nitrospiria bacterium]|nr:cation:proton antiporter [Nitrospiria bacterium]
MTVNLAFALIGIIIFIGFFGSVVFQRTRIPDLPVLLFIGILLGPFLHLLDPAQLANFTPYFATFAMIMILFDGGMALDLRSILRQFTGAVLLAVLGFLATAALTAFIAWLFGYPLPLGLLLGAIVGGTSGAIVMPLVAQMRISEEAKTILSLESSLTDILCVVIGLSLVHLIPTGRAEWIAPIQDLLGRFIIGILLGAACGIGWSKFLERLKRPQFSYMLTLAILFLLFSLAEFIRGNGAMAALVFGLILGNYKRFPSLFGTALASNSSEATIRGFHGELAFFIRTFFFVYIGLIFTMDHLGPLNLLLCLLIFGAIVLSRYLAAQLLVWVYRDRKPEKMVLWLMTARGLAAAVLAPLPVAAGIPGTEAFVDIVLLIILLTNLLTAIGVTWTERSALKPSA